MTHFAEDHDPLDRDSVDPLTENADLDYDVSDADPTGDVPTPLSTRARAQQRLSNSRASIQTVTTRARAAARRPVEPVVTSNDDEESVTPTTSDRIRAYRSHIISAAAAALAILVLVLRRRAGHTTDDEIVDLGEWHLHAEPTD